MLRRRGLFGIVALVGAVATATASCQEPTQVMVAFRTNACADTPELGIVTGPTLEVVRGRVAAGELTATQRGCGNRPLIGTLTLTPAADSGGTVVGVLALRGKRPEECLRDPASTGCITARRRFVFLKRTSLGMNIDLDLDCEGKACDAFTTCSRGTCVDARVDCTENGTCGEPGLTPNGNAGDGGGPVDARVDGPPLAAACPAQAVCRGGDGGRGCTLPEQCCLFSAFGNLCGVPGSSSQCASAGCCASDAPCPTGLECCYEGSATRCAVKGTCLGSRPCETVADCRTGEGCGNSATAGGPPLYARGTSGPPRYCSEADGGGTVVIP
jgi:hypothetical protein